MNSPSPLPPDQATPSPQPLAVIGKWGDAAIPGFSMVPDVLLKNQDRLGLSPTDLVVLLNISLHWWFSDRPPFPKGNTIARRMGVTPRTIQRSLKKLEQLDLIHRPPAMRGKTALEGSRQVFDLVPLAARLSLIARHDPVYDRRLSAMRAEADRAREMDSKDLHAKPDGSSTQGPADAAT